jgi:hypothetical protein
MSFVRLLDRNRRIIASYWNPSHIAGIKKRTINMTTKKSSIPDMIWIKIGSDRSEFITSWSNSIVILILRPAPSRVR